jgi:hypothetical protein
MSTTDVTCAISKASELGQEHGEAAASSLFNGNTDTTAYAAVLAGIEDGDPEVLDALPHADLSGEYADGMTPARLAEACDRAPDLHYCATCDEAVYEASDYKSGFRHRFPALHGANPMDPADWMGELCDAYEEAFSVAVHDEVERVCREHVGPDLDALRGRLLAAVREHSGMDLDAVRQAGEHGADSGFAGFTYTSDAADFYDANRDDVWELLDESADQFGQSPLELVASFNRADMATSHDGFACLLAWFVLEEVGRSLSA